LAARYRYRWVTPDDARERRVGTTLLRFMGERITQVGSRWIAQQSTARPDEPEEPSAG
jgi:hypothetical protein